MSSAFPISVRAEATDGTFDWIDLPLTNAEHDEVCRRFGENPHIVSYDKIPFDLEGKFSFDASTPLWQTQLIALALESADGAEELTEQLEWCAPEKLPATPLGLANLLMQTDQVPWHDYDVPITVVPTSGAEGFGYTIAKNMGLYDALKTADIASFFDFEAFGEKHATHHILGEEGYLDTEDTMPAWDTFDWDEVRTYVADHARTDAWVG